MSFRTLVSPLALAAAMTLSTGAFAQTMVGDQAVTDEDLPAVSEHCQMLADGGPSDEGAIEEDAATDEMAGEETPLDATAGDTASEGDEATAEDDTANDGMATDPEIATPGDPMAGDANLDMDAITLEDCAAAGLV